jgi:hypothetical protein
VAYTGANPPYLRSGLTEDEDEVNPETRRPKPEINPKSGISTKTPHIVSCNEHKNFFLVERLGVNRVKRTMARVKTVLALLIPALWLVASMSCALDPVNGFVSEGSSPTLTVRGNGKADSSIPSDSLAQSARRWSRRINTQSGHDGPSTPAALTSGQFPPTIQNASLPARSSLFSLNLGNCWQFYWRTALEPRAPSSVS